MKLFVVLFVLFTMGLIWGAASCDWKLPAGRYSDCDEEDEDDCEPHVRTGSRGHKRSYSHGGKY